METNKLLVTIIVRTKNRPVLLKRALESIAAQTYKPLEVVLINDGGTELPVNELRSILKDVLLNYINFESNMGRASAGNAGFAHAKGDYIAFLDDDDEFYPEHINILVSNLRQSSQLIAYTDSEIVNHVFDSNIGTYTVQDRYVLFSDDFSYEKLLVTNYIPLICLLFDKNIKHNLHFDEQFDLYEDWDLLIRLGEIYPFQHIKKVTARYNRNLSDQISINGKLHYNGFIKIMNKHKDKITPDALFSSWKTSVHERELSHLRDKLEAKIHIMERYIEEKEKLLEEYKSHVKNLENMIKEKDKSISKIEKLIAEQEKAISQKHRKMLDMQIMIENIHNSFGWNMLEILRKIWIRLLPTHTRRRYYSDLLIKSIKVIKIHGFKAYFNKAYRKLNIKRQYKSPRNDSLYFHRYKQLPQNTVDIVIPIYNAYDDFRECMKSILANTDLNDKKLILVDDKSTDARIISYLIKLGEDFKNSNIIVLNNERNNGFASAVNRGLKFSERDVIILNSDTIVTRGWVDKMKKAAYSKRGVATVTPLSNNATICSIPDFCKNNAIPDGFIVETFGEFIEKISLRYYPEIPTGVGFCMYIKRDVLNEVGYFDERNFSNGYGEENDFCWRASQKGYLHILDDATFIFHRGGGSFTSDIKLIREESALNVMQRLHPDYNRTVQQFIQENPLRSIQEYISLRLSLANRRLPEMTMQG